MYGLAGVGLLIGTAWGFKLAWIPGVVFVYHAISFWAWTGNQRKAGHRLQSPALRVGWTLVNLVAGLLTITVSWNAT